MKKLRIYFSILYKEFLGGVKVKTNKQQFLIYAFAILYFLSISLSITPEKLTDYTSLNHIMVLGFLQIFSIAILSYLFAYMSIDYSYNLNMFFKINFLDNIHLNVVKTLLIAFVIQIISIAIILIQVGIPLITTLGIPLFFKFLLITSIGVNIIFIPLDGCVSFLEKNYDKMNMSMLKRKIFIIFNLLLIYIAIYYSVLIIWFHELKKYDFYYKFLNLNNFYIILAYFLSILCLYIYSYFIKKSFIQNYEISHKYQIFFKVHSHSKNMKYVKLLARNKKNLLVSLFIIGVQMLNYLTIKDLNLSYTFSYFTSIIGINFYSFLTYESYFLKLNNNNDEYKIYFTLIFIFFILNIPLFFLINNQYIYLLEAFTVYLISIYVGIVFPRENNSINKFMSNFIFGILIIIIFLANEFIFLDPIKHFIYMLGILFISTIIIKILRRSYETKNISKYF